MYLYTIHTLINKKPANKLLALFSQLYRSLLTNDYTNKDRQEYTFWDYMYGSWQKNNGMRIDHFLISKNILSRIKNIKIDRPYR